MGRVIADVVAGRQDCTVVAGIDKFIDKYADFEIYPSVSECPVKGDVIIDFSNPSLLNDLLRYAKQNHTPIVIATTGYTQEQIDQIKESAKEIPVFFTFNMYLGINLLVDLAKRLLSWEISSISKLSKNTITKR